MGHHLELGAEATPSRVFPSNVFYRETDDGLCVIDVAWATVEGRLTAEWRPVIIEQLRREVLEPGHDRDWYRHRNTAIKYREQAATNGRAEVLLTGQETTSRAIRVQGVRWTRRPNAGACDMCLDLARSVVVALPARTPMQTHKGCGCVQRPEITTGREPS